MMRVRPDGRHAQPRERHMAEETAKPSLADLPAQAQSSYETTRQKAVEWEQGLEESIREKPIRAVLIAAGVGVLFALLWGRK